MIGIDTNVLLRHLTMDDPAQASLARRAIDGFDAANPGHVSVIVLCELVWVLERAFRRSREEIAVAIQVLLHTRHLLFEDFEVVEAALTRYRRGRVGFSDTLLGLRNRMAGCEATLTFDRDAAAQAEFRLLTATGVQEMR